MYRRISVFIVDNFVIFRKIAHTDKLLPIHNTTPPQQTYTHNQYLSQHLGCAPVFGSYSKDRQNIHSVPQVNCVAHMTKNTIPIWVGGRNTSALIDPGASVTIINKDFFSENPVRSKSVASAHLSVCKRG